MNGLRDPLSRSDERPVADTALVDFLRFVTIAISISFLLVAASSGVLLVRSLWRLSEILVFLAGFGPAIAAIARISSHGGTAAVSRFVRARLADRAPLYWIAGVGAAPFVFYTASLALAAMFGTHAIAAATRHPTGWTPSTYLLAAGYFLLTAAGEEFGWRAYALPRLQTAYGALSASLLVGLAWAVWHLPGFLTPTFAEAGIKFGWFAIEVIALSVVFTATVNSSGSSLIAPVVLHAALNFASGRFGIPPAIAGTAAPYLISVALSVAIAAALIVVLGPRTLSTRKTRVTI
jgi:membrane protease YdiL (CAAX protease family)